MIREYEEKWTIKETRKGGGQGDTFRVKRVESMENEEEYILKLLKEQNNSERRERIRNEVHALKILNKIEISEYDEYERNDDSNKYFPKVIDDNCEKYKNKEIELYYVMEYINGKELYSTITAQPNNLDEILESFMNLLNSVNICHKKGIIHRDIKPSNIMCRNGKLRDIVLIDFGIAYVEELDTDDTKLGQELENRFLHLPEKGKPSKEGKRDKRSDITYCVGILFYMLTRKNPKYLKDEKERKPHEQFENITYLQWVGSEKLKVFNAIFDKGFEYDIDKRYKDIEELIDDINIINKYNEKEYLYNDKIKSFCLTTVLQKLKLTNKNRDVKDIIITRMKEFDNQSISLGFCKLSKIGDFFYLNNSNLWVKEIGLSYNIENDLEYMFIPKVNFNMHYQLREDIELYATINFIENKRIRLTDFYIYTSEKKQEVVGPLDKYNSTIIKNSDDTVISCEFIEEENLLLYLCEARKLKIYDFSQKLSHEHMIDGAEGNILKSSFSYRFEYIALLTDKTMELYGIDRKNINEVKFKKINLPSELLADNNYFLDIKFCNKNNILIVMTDSNIYSYNINTNEIFSKKIKKLKLFSVKHGEILSISNKDENFIVKIENTNYILNINNLDFEKNKHLPYDAKYINYNSKDEIQAIIGDRYIYNEEDCYSKYGYHPINITESLSFNVLNMGVENIYYMDQYENMKIYNKVSDKKCTIYKKNNKNKVKKICLSKGEKYIAIIYEDSRIEIVSVNIYCN